MVKDYNKRVKAKLLGESLTVARSRLIKIILFDFAKQLGKDICFRCGDKIKVIEDFTLDHKDSWILSSDPIRLFFDLENVAFSHHICNSRANSAKKKIYCKNGHKFTKKDTYIRNTIKGWQTCRICKRNEAKERRKRNKAISSIGKEA